MKRTALLGALLVAILACTAALSTPKPAQAIMCCETGYQTGQYWTMADTCANAQAAYRAAARPEANDTCGGATQVCAFSIPGCDPWTDPDPNIHYKVDGVANFGCKYDCGPPLP